MEENISAISTARGVGGVAIIRISGSSPLEIAKKMFSPSGKTAVTDFLPYVMYTGEIDCGTFTDYGLCVYFKGPKSYTGEDMVEFHCHGGIAISEGVLKRTFALGARPATNGEFTKRAFLNGKLSLSSCEGLIDMINSESVAEVKAGYYLYREKLNKQITDIQNDITFALAEIDANIDYPEEDLETFATTKTETCLNKTITVLKQIINRYNSGKKIKNGVKVALCGEPNTGKSSILNALLNYDKAIVTSIAGTTRDVVEGTIVINDVRFNLFDTAGIHDTSDEIEKIGIDRSKKAVDESDLIVYIVDCSREFSLENKEIYDSIKNKNHIVVYNKSDLIEKDIDLECNLKVSAINYTGIEELKNLIFSKTIGVSTQYEQDFLTEERHYIAINNALDCFIKANDSLNCVPLDLIALDIKKGWDYLGEISGLTASENIINEIFAKFCVGK